MAAQFSYFTTSDDLREIVSAMTGNHCNYYSFGVLLMAE